MAIRMIAVHRRDLPRVSFSAVCGGHTMPYQGTLVSLAEMLEMLGTRRRSEAVASLELERAFEDKAIVLRLRDGSNSEGEALYRTLTDAEMSAVITVLRDFPNRMRIPYIRHMNIPFEMVKAACAVRVQFETRCDLVERQADSPKSTTKGPAPGSIDRYGDSDRARFPEIEALLKAGKTLTAATNEIGPTLEGPATPESKAKRVRDRFKKMKAAN
jgi:hypothetical protein